MTSISSRASIQNAEYRLDDTKRKCGYDQANAVGLAATEGSNLLHRGVDAVMDGVPPSAKALAWLVGCEWPLVRTPGPCSIGAGAIR